jgi:hypothetical protein
VGRERETAVEKGEEHHPEALIWVGDNLIAKEDHLHGLRKKSLLLGLGQIIFRDRLASLWCALSLGGAKQGA